MSSEAQQNRGYPLPETITGHDLICVRLMIPDVTEYRAAFHGALKSLTEWWNWEKTGDTKGSEAATYWRQLIHENLVLFDCVSGDEVRLQVRMIDAGDGCQQMQQKYEDQSEEEWEDVGIPICDGTDGTTPDCPDCDEPFDEDDGNVPDPDLEPDDDAACKVADFVANSMIDNYYVPALEAYIEDILNNSGSPQDLARKLLRLGFFGGASFIQGILDIINFWIASPAMDFLDDIQTTEKRDLVKCCLYCALKPEISITPDVFQAWRDCMSAEEDATLDDFVRFLDGQLLATIRTEAALAVADESTPECDCECGVCETRLATFDEGGQEFDVIVGSVSTGETGNGILAADVGAGWAADHAWEARVQFPLDATCAVKTVSARYRTDVFDPPAATTGYSFIVETYLGGVLQSDAIVAPELSTGEWHTVSLTYPVAVTGDMVQIYAFNGTNTEGRTIEIRLDDVTIEFE